MSVTILVPGVLIKEGPIKYTTRCHKCGTLFEHERTDLTSIFNYVQGFVRGITCPLNGCGQFIERDVE